MTRFSCEAEREYLETHGPAKHASTANLIDALMDASYYLGDLCTCDVDGRCRRHCAIDCIVERNVKAGRDWRPSVERFVKRVGAMVERRRRR